MERLKNVTEQGKCNSVKSKPSSG